MVKKVISYGFLLLANIILLAHAVIPHHHHNGGITLYICYFLPSNHTEEHRHNLYHSHADGHCHVADNHSHERDISDYCLLNSPYIRANQNRQENVTSSNWDSPPDTSLSYPCDCAACQAIIPIDYGNGPFRHAPYIPFSHCSYLAHSTGLRAPPVC